MLMSLWWRVVDLSVFAIALIIFYALGQASWFRVSRMDAIIRALGIVAALTAASVYTLSLHGDTGMYYRHIELAAAFIVIGFSYITGFLGGLDEWRKRL